MPRPLLPAIDAAGQVREVGFALLLRHRRPVEVTELAEATGLGADTAGEAVTKLAGAGWLDLDDSGRVSGAAGLPRRPHDLVPGPRLGGPAVTRDVELLWFSDCPNHPTARRLLEEVIAELAPGTPIRDVDASDPVAAARLRFPGSPTIRVDGRDIDPTYVDSGEYAPRCRLYRTRHGLRGVPERRWIEDALRRA